MAFFNKLGATISSKSKDLAQKAKVMAEIANLNSCISSEEEKINQALQDIGKLFYEKNKEAIPPEYQDFFNNIHQSKEAIEKHQQEIRQIKNVKHCSSCGAEMPETSVFCGDCGAEQAVEKTEVPTAEEQTPEALEPSESPEAPQPPSV